MFSFKKQRVKIVGVVSNGLVAVGGYLMLGRFEIFSGSLWVNLDAALSEVTLPYIITYLIACPLTARRWRVGCLRSRNHLKFSFSQLGLSNYWISIFQLMTK